MTSKQRRRKNFRKEQSLKDKDRILQSDVTVSLDRGEFSSSVSISQDSPDSMSSTTHTLSLLFLSLVR